MDTKRTEEIKTHPTFEALFPINPALLAKIEQDMRDGSYDFSQPIILATWQGQDEPVVIDGHTRLQAASNEGIEQVPVWPHEFDTEEEALEKAIKLQANRRNMSDAEILTCIDALDQRRRAGRPPKELAQRCANFSEDAPAQNPAAIRESCADTPKGKSAEALGELLGISTRKVEQTRTVLDHADTETVEAVKKGEKSINKASQETQKPRKRTTAKDKKDETKKPISEEFQGVQQVADENKESAAVRPVFLSLEHFAALRELGGCIEVHVGIAVDCYLESQRTECRGFPVETSEDIGHENRTEPEEEEYFDPDNYVAD